MSLPPGYEWVIPSSEFFDDFVSATLSDSKEIELCPSRGWITMAVSIVQLVFSCITLYRTRGDQIARFGYAAYGLSVFPYTLMTAVNLICCCFVGQYQCVYVVNSAILKEASLRPSGKFDGTIGTLAENEPVDRVFRNTLPVTLINMIRTLDSDSLGNPMNALRVMNTSFNLNGIIRGMREHIVGMLNEFTDLPPLIEQFMVLTGIAQARDNNVLNGNYTAAYLSLENDGHGTNNQILVVRVRDTGITKRFRFRAHESLPRGLEPTHEPTHHRFGIGSMTNQDWRIMRRPTQYTRLEITLLWFLLVVGPIVVLFCPPLFIFAMTRYRKAKSTVSQRAWIMAWSCANQFFFFLPGLGSSRLAVLIYSWVSIVGMVQVAKMYKESETCSLAP